MLASTPDPPYVAVIFTSERTAHDDVGYQQMAARMDELAAQQSGYLGVESARGADGFGITVSYWVDEPSARAWKRVAGHIEAQRLGRDEWYRRYSVRVAVVGRAYTDDPTT